MIYIKAPKVTVAFLGLLNNRTRFADGNYLLWGRDVQRLQGSGTLGELLPQIGCVEMTAPEVRVEQNGGEPTPLPGITLKAVADFARENGYELPEAGEDNGADTRGAREGAES